MEEGRFLRIDEGGIKTIFETGESQGIIAGDGGMYLLNPGDVTRTYKVSKDGIVEEFMELQGIFYDIKTYEDDLVVCLGNINGETRIKIFKGHSPSREISNFVPSGIIFGSCLFIDDDLIYLGGFDEKNIFKLVVLNFAGVVVKSFDIRVKSGDRIISKIDKLDGDILLIVSGEKDSLVVLNQNSGVLKEIYAKSIGIKNIIDMNVRGSDVFILDGRNIYSMDIEDLKAGIKLRGKKSSSEKLGLFPYAYLMYIYSLTDKLIKYLDVFIIFYILIMLSLIFAFKPSKWEMIFLLSSGMLVTFFIVFIFDMIDLQDKAVRVEYLLKITLYEKLKNILIGEVFIGVFTAAVYLITFYPYWSAGGFLLSFALSFLIFLFAGFLSLKAVKDKSDIIIDLLKEDDDGIKGYVREAIKRIKDEKSERMLIKIKTNSSIKGDYLERWINSRGNILNNEVFLSINGERIIVVVDFSKRDVRYSRFSIVMDFLTFVKHYFSVNEIEIRPADESSPSCGLENQNI